MLVFHSCLITRASGKNKTHETFHRSWVQTIALSKRSKVETCLTKTQMCLVACVTGAEFFQGKGRNFQDARALEGRGPHKT